ncbi:MAG: endo alpha-1,4 polygalactosaminidase [Bacteroidota bacterium]
MKKLIVFALLLVGCDKIDPDLKNVNFREEMRTFVGEISNYAKSKDSEFIIIPQNGVKLATLENHPDGQVATLYLDKIDAVGQEDLLFGYDQDNQKSPVIFTSHTSSYLDIVKDHGKAILVTDYCSDPSKMDDSYTYSNQKEYISFAAPYRELNVIPGYPPAPRDSNTRDILTINDASNFLYLINPENYSSKEELIFALAATNYDVIIMDAFFDNQLLLAGDLESIKYKYNGGTRLLISYMSIGEAENYRYYWKSSYKVDPPEWLSDPNPDWPGNYKVKYWMGSWKSVIYGDNNAYLDMLLEVGFDGAYLDIVDGYLYYENLMH